jgi:dTDP-4-dehydrorhamnose 3,5-epimerase
MSIKTINSRASTSIKDCEIVPVSANRDERGCLYEIFRETWPGAFRAVQWNACASDKGVVRGAHVHVDYSEFYTLPRGEVIIGLADIRRDSPTFGRSAQFHWADRDAVAFVVPRGVAHVVLFNADSVLAFGLSDYWERRRDVVGCQWDAPEFGFAWPDGAVRRSARDLASGTYSEMLDHYQRLTKQWQNETLTAS